MNSKNPNYLVHHGIMGQKWGKKNGPPYPLAPSDHSAAEKKAAKDMSDDELRKAINRKRLENDYRRYSAERGANKKINDTIGTASKALRTTGKVARAVSKTNEIKGQDKIKAIDEDDSLTKNEKKAAKREIKEYRNKEKADNISNLSNTVANVANKKVYINDGVDISSMSDAELRKAVDRMMLESQYDSMTNSKSGKDYVDAILDTAGNIAEIAGTAITIALLIKKAKG